MPSDVAGLGILALGLSVFITVLWTKSSVSEASVCSRSVCLILKREECREGTRGLWAS